MGAEIFWKANFRAAGFFTALAIALGILVGPLLPEAAPNRTLAILAFAAILWMTEAIPLALTAVLVPILSIALGLLGPDESILPFFDPVIFLFMGGFVLAAALAKYGLDGLIATKLMALARGNLYRASLLLMLATSVLASWIGNTATTTMMIPLGLGLLSSGQQTNPGREAGFLILGIAYAANSGGVMTLIGTPPNAIGAAILDLSFAEWLSYGIPVFAVTFPLMVLVLTLYFKPDLQVGAVPKADVRGLAPGSGKLMGIFAMTVALWMAEGVLAPLLGIEHGYTALVAVACMLLIFASKLMGVNEIVRRIRWDVLLLFGGGLCLGLVVEKSGLGGILIEKIISVAGGVWPMLFLWLLMLFCIALTEFMSNTASAALLLPLLFSLAVRMDSDPLALVLPATFAASYGFMLPVGTPPNAMAYGTGLVPQKDMLRSGLVMNLVFSAVLTVLFHFIF